MANRHGLLNKISIKADAQGNPPAEIELLQIGIWHTPWHGDFSITPDDLQEYVRNFELGVGLVAGDKRAPIDYGHADYDKAAGWIGKLAVSTDGSTLLGQNVEWTPAAAQAIKDGEWAYISAEFNPADCLPWEDPEEELNYVENVLTGAALTNIPLFKKLKPIMASRKPVKKKLKADETSGGDKSKSNQGEGMDLEELRKKELAELTDEQKAFLAEHKTDLTEDELKKFELSEAQETDEEKAAREAKEAEEAEAAKKAEEEAAEEAKKAEEAAKVEASKKATVTMSADEAEKLRASAKRADEAEKQLLENKLKASVKSHVDRGAIKPDQADEAVKILMASSGKQREQLEAFIGNLPSNALIAADAKGSDEQDDDDVELTDADKQLAKDFGNSEEEIKEFKKAQAEKEK